MSADFDSIHNHHEHLVIAAVRDFSVDYPLVTDDMLADVACIALNRLPARYIRHKVDMAFYMTDADRARTHEAVDSAVKYAFEFLLSRCSGQHTG